MKVTRGGWALPIIVQGWQWHPIVVLYIFCSVSCELKPAVVKHLFPLVGTPNERLELSHAKNASKKETYLSGRGNVPKIFFILAYSYEKFKPLKRLSFMHSGFALNKCKKSDHILFSSWFCARGNQDFLFPLSKKFSLVNLLVV